ncbi:hypothetical protein F4861DRAFT_61688 [Xylaria intraflava]|nr:hypothetical protein F4861DRAFT_61688 [Xylaria intraflava]
MALPFSVPASLDASFTMSRPTEADIDRLAQVYYDSFSTDPLNTYWWPSDRDAMFEWLHARIRRKMTDPSVRHFQVLSDQNEVVAFARWDIPKGHEATFGKWIGINGGPDRSGGVPDEAATPAETPAPAAIPELPRGVDPSLCESFFSILPIMAAKWNAAQMLDLSLLCTSPKYYRRGAAKALLTPMLAIADAAGLRSYVEATPSGRPLYEKLGFRTVDVNDVDVTALTKGKIEGIISIAFMIREPQSS